MASDTTVIRGYTMNNQGSDPWFPTERALFEDITKRMPPNVGPDSSTWTFGKIILPSLTNATGLATDSTGGIIPGLGGSGPHNVSTNSVPAAADSTGWKNSPITMVPYATNTLTMTLDKSYPRAEIYALRQDGQSRAILAMDGGTNTVSLSAGTTSSCSLSMNANSATDGYVTLQATTNYDKLDMVAGTTYLKAKTRLFLTAATSSTSSIDMATNSISISTANTGLTLGGSTAELQSIESLYLNGGSTSQIHIMDTGNPSGRQIYMETGDNGFGSPTARFELLGTTTPGPQIDIIAGQSVSTGASITMVGGTGGALCTISLIGQAGRTSGDSGPAITIDGYSSGNIAYSSPIKLMTDNDMVLGGASANWNGGSLTARFGSTVSISAEGSSSSIYLYSGSSITLNAVSTIVLTSLPGTSGGLPSGALWANTTDFIVRRKS